MTKPAVIAAICVFTIAFFSCKRVPGYVMDPDEMALVLADIHTAEAVVDMNHIDYATDSAKLALKQAVYDRHGITAVDFDTSLIWYGHNIGKYIDVYDKTIEILEKRSAEAGNLATLEAISMAGDSVDIWAASQYLALNRRMPSLMATFDISEDDNWEKGDVYTWRVKLIGAGSTDVNWGITANYADSVVEVLSAVTNVDGWNEISFVGDTARQMVRLRGFMQPRANVSAGTLWIDSVSLVRKRFYPDAYSKKYRQRPHKELH